MSKMSDITEKKQRDVFDEIMRRNADLINELVRSTSDQLRLDFRCSSTGREFKVFLKEETESNLYKVSKIVTDDINLHSSSSMSVPILTDVKKNKLDIDVNMIEGKIKCPYCDGGKSDIIECGCGRLSCGGGVSEKNGKDFFKCPWCKSGGYVQETLEKISGEGDNGGEIQLESRKKLFSNPNEENPALTEK